VYQFDPDARPDDQFTAGDLRWLVPGNRGRLLDTRRTPVQVTLIDLPHGYFEVEILAFEDHGARWLVPLEDVTSYQFEPGGATAATAAVTAMKDAIQRLGVTTAIEADQERSQRTTRQLAAERARAAAWLTARGVPDRIDAAGFIDSRRGSPEAPGWLDRYLAEAGPGLADLDHELAAGYLSNPGSGDLVRAHLITMARLGLSSYRGKAVRDPAALSGRWAAERRAAHIISRAGFTQALWQRADHPGLMIYRGIGLQGRAALREPATPLISATFSRPLAETYFNSERAGLSALLRRRLPIERLFMTFLETAAMTTKYLEAEATLFSDGSLL
jgi:hypothetical protein